jgi:uncharacterized protein YcgI (DUF1989 family)
MNRYESIAGDIVQDVVVPARGSWSGVLKKGQMMRIVDLEGKQATSFVTMRTITKTDTPPPTR